MRNPNRKNPLNSSIDNNENEIQAKEETHGIVNLCQIDTNVHECFVSILEIGDLLVQWSHQKKEWIWRKLLGSAFDLKKKKEEEEEAFLGSRISRGGLI